MKLLIQRVSEARVDVAGETVGAIGPGILVLVGIEATDTPDIGHALAEKLLRFRMFADEAGKMNWDIHQADGSLLVVSQFTLAANTRKGNRPSFDTAAPPALALALFDGFVATLRSLTTQPIATGQFGAHMQVHLVNDGPVTFLLESGKP